jgi:MinD-like ATPase involved in chromosome partitioning or flagellar assembly
VVLALSPSAERAVERLLFADQTRLALVASAFEAAELERLAVEHNPDAVLLSPDLPGLTAARCARLRADGLRLVGLALDEASVSALPALGLDAIVDADIDVDALATALSGGEGRGVAQADMRPRADQPLGRGSRDGGGTIVAVVGSRGAPGASECALSLAALAQEHWPTGLVECDLLGGGLDLRLGTDGREGSLIGVVRACTVGDGALGELLERWLVRRPGWPPVLLAPPDPAEPLDELFQPGALAAALRALAHTVPLVVCDVGFLLEEAGDAPPLARCHREALACADAVLLVIGARDRQLRDGLAQLDLLRVELEIPDQRLRVAYNGVGGPGAGSRRAATQMLAGHLAERGLAVDAILPFDARALRRAEGHGVPFVTASRRGPYARALRRLLDQLFLPGAVARPRERKLRLALRIPTQARDEEVSLPWRTS